MATLPASFAVVDLAGDAAILDHAKAVCHGEILAAAHHAIRVGRRRGVFPALAVTQGMVDAVISAYRGGVHQARAEAGRMGRTPGTFTDIRPMNTRVWRWLPDSVKRVIIRLQGDLDRLTVSIARDLQAEGMSAALGRVPALVKKRLAEVPGALDAASRIAPPAFTGGLADHYTPNQHLFSGFVYSAEGDRGTCDECDSKHGTFYESLEDAARDGMDGFGPNPLCRGGFRCRCRLVPQP